MSNELQRPDQDPELESVTEYLSAKEKKDITQIYRRRTKKCVEVGDVDLRRRTVEDIELIEQCRSFEGGIDFEEVVESLQGIIGAPSRSHSLLAKVEAIRAYADVVFMSGSSLDLHASFLFEAIHTETEDGGSSILAGAFLGSVKRLYGEKGLDYSGFEESVFGEIDSKAKAGFLLSVQTCADKLDEMVRKNELRMKLPEVIIASGETLEPRKHVPIEEGYPDKTMYLGVGFLPSLDKLQEAVKYGMPDPSKQVLVRKLPCLMAGVNGRRVSRKDSGGDRLVSADEKRFIHISLSSLREPEVLVWDKFLEDRHFSRDEVRRSLSFDSLTYWVAMRSIEKRFRRGSTHTLKAVVESVRNDKFPEKRRRQENFISEAIGRVIADISPDFIEVERKDGSVQRLGILSLALEELRGRHEDCDWSLDDVSAHLAFGARALVKRVRMGEVVVRDKEDIADIYRTHLWDSELNDEDKVELALGSLSNEKSPLWEYLDGVESGIMREIIQSFEPNSRPLSDKARLVLLELVNERRDDVFVIRWQSIRDKPEPSEGVDESE